MGIMMLSCPKGYKYWCKNGSDLTIKPDAPCWAKKNSKIILGFFKRMASQIKMVL